MCYHLLMEDIQPLYPETKQKLEVLWSIAQVATYFHVCAETVHRWARSGKMRSVKTGGRVRIPRSEVERMAGETRNKLTQ